MQHAYTLLKALLLHADASHRVQHIAEYDGQHEGHSRGQHGATACALVCATTVQLYVPTMFDSIGNQTFTFALLQAASKARSTLCKETALAASMHCSPSWTLPQQQPR